MEAEKRRHVNQSRTTGCNVSRPSEDEGMDKNRIFTNIDLKSLAGPPTNCLNHSRRDTSLSEGRGTTGSKGVAGNGSREHGAQTGHEPEVCGDSATQSKA